MAVSGALRAGRGGFRAVRATERRQVGCGRPSTGSGWWWGVAFGYSYRREFTMAFEGHGSHKVTV